MMQRPNQGTFDSDIIKVLSQLGNSDSATDWQWDTVERPAYTHPSNAEPLTVDEFRKNIPAQVYPTLEELLQQQLEKR